MDNYEKKQANLPTGIHYETIIIMDTKRKKSFFLKYEDIFAILSYGNYVEVKTQKDIYITYKTMKEAEKTFCSTNKFIRISRTAIISKDKIESIELNKVTLKNELQLIIGRSFRNAFFEKMRNKYF